MSEESVKYLIIPHLLALLMARSTGIELTGLFMKRESWVSAEVHGAYCKISTGYIGKVTSCNPVQGTHDQL